MVKSSYELIRVMETAEESLCSAVEVALQDARILPELEGEAIGLEPIGFLCLTDEAGSVYTIGISQVGYVLERHANSDIYFRCNKLTRIIENMLVRSRMKSNLYLVDDLINMLRD